MTQDLPAIIVINAASSAGGTTVARKLQGVLPDVRVLLGVDAFLDALPDWSLRTDVGIQFASDGGIDVSDAYRDREDGWYRLLAGYAASGQPLILDEVLLGAAVGQARLTALFGDATSFWVGVHCDPDVSEAREQKRPDRIDGMAREQAEIVHEGVVYDVVVDGAGPVDDAVDAILATLLARR